MRTSDVQSSLYKYLYEKLEDPFGIKIVENISYVDFSICNAWLVIDSLTHTTGSIPKALYFLHIASKDGNSNDIQVLNRLVDKVLDVVNEGCRIDVFDDSSEVLLGDMEVCETSLSPVVKHPNGGNYRSLTVGIVYAGMLPA